jgi:uncharacterized surface protein with fasciclin (FAS1) repeats
MHRLTPLVLALACSLAAVPALARPPGEPTIAEIVSASASASEPEFTILLAALQAVEADAGFIEALSGRKPYTVFAPTDAAFAALLEELDVTAEELLANEELVAAVLAYHVTRGVRLAPSVVGAKQIRMLDGNRVFPEGISLVDGRERVVDLVPELVNVRAANGVIHGIDRVLLPPTD